MCALNISSWKIFLCKIYYFPNEIKKNQTKSKKNCKQALKRKLYVIKRYLFEKIEVYTTSKFLKYLS